MFEQSGIDTCGNGGNLGEWVVPSKVQSIVDEASRFDSIRLDVLQR
jgi:hypothetical protein